MKGQPAEAALDEQHLRKFKTEEINALPIRRYEGEVVVVRDETLLRDMAKHLSGEGVLGFDTETRPSFHKGKSYNPSLVQLATEERVYVIQLSMVPFSGPLANLLADSGVVKSGVAVDYDVKELAKLKHFEPGGFVDLGEVARKAGMQTFGLRNLAANLFGFRISKSAQCSNWSRRDLSRQQIIYAATDAWLSRKIHVWFVERGLV